MMFKNTLKKIMKSFGRYVSILVIVCLGVAFYVGIRESAPRIEEIQKDYYNDTNLMDLAVQSSIGLQDEDVSALANISEVDDIVGTYSVIALDGEDVIKIHALEDEINKVVLIDGVMPTHNYEVLADAKEYSVGDTIHLENDALNETDYTVVGTIRSPLYTGDDYGGANIGNGKLKSFLYVLKDTFCLDYYTEIYITMKKDMDDIPYSKSYNDKVSFLEEKVEEVSRIREYYWEEQFSYFFPNLDVNWYISDRNDVVTSYQILESQYDKIKAIAGIIPYFFILVVILMISNTMTRLIIEERGEMGTFASLGISNFTIIGHYLFYVLSSTILGCVIGFFAGSYIIPKLVYNCFPVLMPEMSYQFIHSDFLFVLLVAFLLMSVLTIFTCYKKLKQKPAYLLRPESPKSGKVIVLEKISIFWNHLSFSWKVTIRNIFRYKKRVFMTLIDTAGCTFLIFIGFAIKDSINGIGDIQYKKIFKYDALAILKEEIHDISFAFSDYLSDKVARPFLIRQSSFKIVHSEDSLDSYLVVPENTVDFYEYFSFIDSNSNETLSLPDDGVIVTPRIRKKFHLNIGDTITIEDFNKKTYEVTIRGITQNYVSNYIYMSKEYYERIFQENLLYNAMVYKEKKENVTSELLKSDYFFSINQSSDLTLQANNAIKGLNYIVLLLVITSSMLCLAVLFNLCSINISERQREISTLKVLGFYERETNEYIYRETMVMVFLGIALGSIFGTFFQRYIVSILESDTLMLLKTIKFSSYIYAILLTLLFAIIMQIVTYFKVKKIDMIESLKSVD